MVRRRWPRWLRNVVLGAAGVLLVVATAEVAIRVAKPAPRAQIVRHLATPPAPAWDPAVPYWENTRNRWNDECVERRPDAARVLFLGDSIFFGHMLDAQDVFTGRLQRSLDSAHGDAAPCVLNHAQAGFSGQQMAEQARVLLPTLKPAVLFWEVWFHTNAASYTRLGDAAYQLGTMAVDAGGAPATFGLPAGLNGFLFRNLRLHEYASLALATARPRDVERETVPLVRERIRAVRDLAAAQGTSMVLVSCPQLDQPFGSPSPDARQAEDATRRIADELGIPVIFLREVLADQDVERVRQNTCCHYNAEGHRVLAERLQAEVEARLAARADR